MIVSLFILIFNLLRPGSRCYIHQAIAAFPCLKIIFLRVNKQAIAAFPCKKNNIFTCKQASYCCFPCIKIIFLLVNKQAIATFPCKPLLYAPKPVPYLPRKLLLHLPSKSSSTTVNHCYIFEPCKPLLHSSNPLVQCYRDVKALRLIILSYYNYIRLQQICLFSSTISGMHQL